MPLPTAEAIEIVAFVPAEPRGSRILGRGC
jgi:hypothetical protein